MRTTVKLFLFLFANLLMSFAVKAFAQSAENLNLNKIVQPPYNCYGLIADGCPNAEKLGIKVGVQFYTFNKYTFFEAIELTRALGLHYIEATVGARICPESDQTIHAGMPREWIDKIKEKLAMNGVRCESIYYWMDGSGKGFEDVVKFCKEMGWMIVSDPKREVNGGVPISYYENILDKYGVKMAFTNHPKSAAYWNPDFTVEDTEGRGENIGASIDIGHYMRGGFDAYEIARRYINIGKMYHFHMRDVSKLGEHGLNIPCGTGRGRIEEIFRILSLNDVKPIMALEFEHDFDNPLPYLIKSIDNINEICGKIILQRKQVAIMGDTIRLYADAAKISSDMNMQDEGDKATIHGWNGPKQEITWNVNLRPGNYEVLLNYAQPNSGSAMTLTADNQELAALFGSTFTWYDFRTFDMGVLKIENGGDITLTLKGIQAAISRDKEGKLKAGEALPDINHICLVPTSLSETSQPTNILDRFKGKSIFNGKNLDGWEGNDEQAMNHFRIEKSSIVGGNMRDDLDKNRFLRTTATYRNFELRLKYRINANDNNYNGGVQLRSKANPNIAHEMIGYQADIISWRSGALYDEQRRWDFLGHQLATSQEQDTKGWNQYIIRCEGPRIRIWLNGVKTTDYIEPFTDTPFEGIGTISQDGHIALQIHEGKASEIWYKDIEIEELPDTTDNLLTEHCQNGYWGDMGDGTYRNPIISADFSDPDPVMVNGEYYMAASTFETYPGVTILHSRDLVNWEIIGSCFDNLTGISNKFSSSTMGRYNEGVYAPSIRYHNGMFYVYVNLYTDGMFVATSKDPHGKWNVQPLKDKNGKPLLLSGWTDPCPYWMEDGKAYLISSNPGRNWFGYIFQMSEDGMQLLDADVDHMKVRDIVYEYPDGGTLYSHNHSTEGNKVYQRNGYIYIVHIEFLDGGNGAGTYVYRSRNIYGTKPDGTSGSPGNLGEYEMRRIDPHGSPYYQELPGQGGLVSTPDDRWFWIAQFNRYGSDGRTPCLIPVEWIDDWPVLGDNIENGYGMMSWRRAKPIPSNLITLPQGSDDFSSLNLGKQWGWNHQPDSNSWSLIERKGFLRLKALSTADGSDSFFKARNTINQRYMSADSVAITVKMELRGMTDGQKAGMVHFNGGVDYALCGVKKDNGQRYIIYEQNGEMTYGELLPKNCTTLYIMSVSAFEKRDMLGQFSTEAQHYLYSLDGKNYHPMGSEYHMGTANFRGDMVGICTYNNNETGYIDVDFFDYFVKNRP